MSHCKRSSKPRRSAAALMLVAGGLAGAVAAPGALGQTQTFQPCIRPGAAKRAETKGIIINGQPGQRGSPKQKAAEKGFIICSPSKKSFTPCIKANKGIIQPCIKTKKGDFIPCLKPSGKAGK